MTTLLHLPNPVHFIATDLDTSDYSPATGPSPADESAYLDLVASLAEMEARDEAFERMERRYEFERWVNEMEAAYGHLPDGPSDDDRAGIIGRSLPYED